MTHYKTIVISDIHLGHPDSKHQAVLNFLENNSFDNLIINGDLIDGLYMKVFSHWKAQHEDFLQRLLNLTDKNHVVPIYIIGNHDLRLDRYIPAYLQNFDIKNNMVYEGIFFCHGHQLDPRSDKIHSYSYMTFALGSGVYLINRVYNRIRKLCGLHYHSILPFFTRTRRKLVGGKKLMERRCIRLAKYHECNGIIYGHTHTPEQKMIGEMLYINSGDRMDAYSAVVQHNDGQRELIDTRK